MYEMEEYDLPEDAIHPLSADVSRVSTYLTFNVALAEYLNLISITYYQPEIGNWNDLRVLSENAIAVAVTEQLDLLIGFNLRYDSEPPDDIKDLDTITKIGFELSFM